MNAVASEPNAVVPFIRPARLFGTILVEAGRLKPEQVEPVLAAQLEHRLRFGDAALQLGLINPADVEFALSCQFDYSYVQRGGSRISEDVVAAYEPFSPAVEALRALRTELTLRWFDDPARKALAIVSAARQEGRSYIAANLAVVFSQLGSRTLLIDADLRNPALHRLFGLPDGPGLSALLSGRAGLEVAQQVRPLAHLSVLPAGVLPPNPQELIARPAFAQLLERLKPHVDVILIDSPAASESADALSIALRAGGALLVARKQSTRISGARRLAASVLHAKASIVGTVFNDF